MLDGGLTYIPGIKGGIKQLKIKGNKTLMLGNFSSQSSSSPPMVKWENQREMVLLTQVTKTTPCFDHFKGNKIQ